MMTIMDWTTLSNSFYGIGSFRSGMSPSFVMGVVVVVVVVNVVSIYVWSPLLTGSDRRQWGRPTMNNHNSDDDTIE
jgi:hypothetical protein